MIRARRGFSLIELMIVVVMIGILTLIAVPKFNIYRDKSNVDAARLRIEAMIATARASAIHKGRLSLFVVSGNILTVYTQDPTTGAWQQQVNAFNIRSVYPTVNVQLGGPGWNFIYYEPRGVTYSTWRPPSTLVFRVVGTTKSDSVCVSRMGQILPKGCTL